MRNASTGKPAMQVGGSQSHESALPIQGDDSENPVHRLEKKIHQAFKEGDIQPVIGTLDPVSGLPSRAQFIHDFTRIQNEITDPYLFLVTLTEASQYARILEVLGPHHADEFVRQGMQRLVKALSKADLSLYQVNVMSFAFVTSAQSHAELKRLAEKTVQSFRAPLNCLGVPVPPILGIGVVSLDTSHASGAEALREAMSAAQTDRRQFNTSFSLYDPKKDEAGRRAFQLHEELREALARGGEGLELAFQPKQNLHTGEICGAEALIRWNHPQHGNISPAEFVALAETSSTITPLTRLVITRSISQLALWQRNGLNLKLSINMSPRNLIEQDFADYVIGSLRQYNVPASNFQIEFTESISSPASLVDNPIFEALRKFGVELALDDFGAGFSNMRYLNELPATVLKIDQAFIRPMMGDPSLQALTRSIIRLARDLNYRVVAEGVENDEMKTLLAEWGCDEAQGYGIAKPMQAADFENWWRAQKRLPAE